MGAEIVPPQRASQDSFECDVLVVGAGIAGAALGYFLAPHARVVVLERESQPGYHSTGRSAALFMESYGTTQVRALTRASRAFLETPPAGFCDGPILSPRGAMLIATPGQAELLEGQCEILRTTSQSARAISAAEACARVPVLRPELVLGAAFEPDSSDIDVDRLHQGYLRGIRRHGGRIVCDADVTGLARTAAGKWLAETRAGLRCTAPIVVDAAGAWCDAVARLAGVAPIGLVPKRRTAFTFAAPSGVEVAHWPTFGSLDETWYVKPDAGMLLGSPANVDPVEPQDVQPEELDIALAIDRIETATTLAVRPQRAWAGLRSFVADGDLVGGFATDAPGFFWLAAQGGYGIQSSAAMGEACAALVRGLPLPPHLAAAGVNAAALAPARLHASAAAALPSQGLAEKR
jgi:D-arginine dehydrogenase